MQNPSSIAEIEAEAERIRMRLRGRAADLMARSSPKVIVASLIERLGADVSGMGSRVAGNIRGFPRAWVLGVAGAAAAFQLGRVVAAPAKDDLRQPAKAEDMRNPLKPDGPGPLKRPGPRQMSNGDQIARSLKTTALGLFGIGAGYVLSRITPSTEREAQLGEALKRASGAQLDGFADRHFLGVAKAMANAFGLARYCAIGLVAISTIAEISRPAVATDRPGAGRP